VVVPAGIGPKWSPDGTRIAFTAGAFGYSTVSYGATDIVVVNLADGSTTRLTDHPARDMWPAWSRDSGRIAFVSDRDGWFELYVMNADGANLTRLTHDVGFTGNFGWSPDGATIAFASDRDGSPELYVMAADGSNPTRLTYGVGFMGQLVWSPAGSIAFACEVEAGNRDICTINADGTNFVRLTSDPADDSAVAFSPVDDRIAFTTGGQIAVMAADGTVSLVGVVGEQPVWAPDGARLAFVGATTSWMGRCYFGGEGFAHNADDFCMLVPDIYVVNVDGTGLSLIANGGDIDWFTPPPGRPVAAFTADCIASACTFDGSASLDHDGTIASYGWQFGDGTTASGATASHTYTTGASYIVTLTVTDNDGGTGTRILRVDANAPPVASYTVACSGPTCTFDGSGSSDPDGTIASYSWQFGDGETSGSPTLYPIATHTYANGTFSAKLTVSDNGGSTNTQTQTVSVVNAPPVVSFTRACTALTCTFDGSASSDPDGTVVSYVWTFGDGTTGSGATANHAYAASGSYTVTLTVTDNGAATSTQDQSVTVSPPAIHVGDLDQANSNQQNMWTATVTITVHTSSHGPLANAVVSGAWNDGSTGSCTTNANGQCAVSRSGILKKTNSVSFTVTNVSRATFVYEPAANHDPDGDSNGTTVSVSRP